MGGGFVGSALTEPSSPNRIVQFCISLEYAELTKDRRTGSSVMSLLSLGLKARLTQSSLGLGLNRLLGYIPSEPPSEGSSDPKTLLA